MTRDDIMKWAREADLGVYLAPQWQLHEELERFANLVAAAEREECAKLCEQWNASHPDVLAAARGARIEGGKYGDNN